VTSVDKTAGKGSTAKGVTLVMAQVLPVIAIVSLFPAIPKLARAFAGAPSAGFLVPALVTIPSLVCAVFAPVAGIIGDRFGRRPSFIGGMILYVLAGIAPLFLDRLELILVSRAILGVAEAFAITISSALIGDYFKEDRHRWVAWVGVATAVTGTALIALGGALADISWRGPFAVYFGVLPILVLALIFIDEPEREPHDPAASLELAQYPWREARIIAPLIFFASLLYYVEPLNIAVVLAMRGAASSTQIGLIQAATALLCVAGSFLYRRIHGLSFGVLVAVAGVFVGLGEIVIGSVPSLHLVIVGAGIQQVGAGMLLPILLAWAQSLLPLEQRGRGMGIWTTAFFCGTFLCSPMVNLFADHTGGLLPAIRLLGILTLACAAAAIFLPSPQRHHVEQ